MLNKDPGKSKPQLFEFDLEKELHKDGQKLKSTLTQIDTKLHDLRRILRQGCPKEDYEAYGNLVRAYLALQKVLNKVSKNKN